MKFALFVCALAVVISIPASLWAVEEFKVSSYGNGVQIWFEAEAFDERSPNENYKLGIEEKALKPTKGALLEELSTRKMLPTGSGCWGMMGMRFPMQRLHLSDLIT